MRHPCDPTAKAGYAAEGMETAKGQVQLGEGAVGGGSMHENEEHKSLLCMLSAFLQIKARDVF